MKNRIHHFVNLFYEPTDKAIELYDKMKKENFLTFFINAGSLQKSSHPWIAKDNNVIFESKFKNIADKNDKYNELTMLYYIRNNYSFDPEDYVQVSHYRMFLDMPKDPDCDIYVRPGAPMTFYTTYGEMLGNIELGWKICHVPFVWELIAGTLSKEERAAFDFWKSKQLLTAPCLLWCMKARLFNEYFDWMFPKIVELDSKIDWTKPIFLNAYQHRQLAFAAERLFSFWCFLKSLDKSVSMTAATYSKYDDFKPITDMQERGMTI